MTTTVPSTDIVVSVEPLFGEAERVALAGFLAGYSGLTRDAYSLDLRMFSAWCQQHELHLFQARRADIECFGRDMESHGRGTQVIAEYEKAGFAWPVDPQGFHQTEGWIKLRPRDMATFGQLLLQNGLWKGRQVVLAGWVRQATTAQTGKAFPDFGASAPGSAFNPTNYGYFWWVEPTTGVTAYYALGFGGQLVEVVPSLHLVIVVSSHVDETHPNTPVVGGDELQHLVDAIVPIIKTHRTR